MIAFAVPIRRARGYVRVVRADSLVRNSLYMMASTVVTAGLGYVFWIVTARVFTSAQVGIGSAVISLCSTVALLTYLGSWAMLIERLHAYERSRAWTSVMVRICVSDSGHHRRRRRGGDTDAGALEGLWLVFRRRRRGGDRRDRLGGLDAGQPVQLAFIAARRADGLFAVQGLVSVPRSCSWCRSPSRTSAQPGSSWPGWSARFIGVGRRRALAAAAARARRRPRRHTGARRGVGPASQAACRASARAARRQAALPPTPRHLDRAAPHQRGRTADPAAVCRSWWWCDSVSRTNAYFYITWMIGSVFFMVSPAISNALFAESVRAGSGLRATVGKAFRVTSFLLLPAIVVMVAGGRLILGIFGHAYASDGYGLLVAAGRVRHAGRGVQHRGGGLPRHGPARLLRRDQRRPLVITLAGAWLLMPRLGLLGVGVGWLGAQVLGAIASIPAFLNLGGKDGADMNTAVTIAPPGRIPAAVPAPESAPARAPEGAPGRRGGDGTALPLPWPTPHVRRGSRPR